MDSWWDAFYESYRLTYNKGQSMAGLAHCTIKTL